MCVLPLDEPVRVTQEVPGQIHHYLGGLVETGICTVPHFDPTPSAFMKVCDQIYTLSGQVQVFEGMQDFLPPLMHLRAKVLTHSDGFPVYEVETSDDYDWLISCTESE